MHRQNLLLGAFESAGVARPWAAAAAVQVATVAVAQDGWRLVGSESSQVFSRAACDRHIRESREREAARLCPMGVDPSQGGR